MKNKNLILLRKSKQMSSKEMANTIGISESYYEKIEYGARKPSYNFLVKFKQAFPDANTEEIFLA